MINRIGYACINMSLSDGVPASKKVLTSRTLRMASFGLPSVNKLILANVKDLLTILKWNNDHGIKFFRISSEIFPFIDHPILKYSIDDLENCSEILSILKQCGDYAKANNMRLSSHPGPYNCLGSPNPDVVHKTLLSLDYHAYLGELMGLDNFVINIHVGGNYGGQYEETAKRFVSNFSNLSLNAQRWLTVENDDKNTGWCVSRLYQYIHQEIHIPITLDVHHWLFCNSETLEDAFGIAFSTWGDKIPKIHYSESAENKRPQAHSDYINNLIPDYYPSKLFDVMLECKAKEKALLQYRNKFNVNN